MADSSTGSSSSSFGSSSFGSSNSSSSNSSSYEHLVEFTVVRYVLCALYVLLAAGFLYQYVLLFRWSGRAWQKIFHVFVVLGCLTRGTFWSLQPALLEGKIFLPNCANHFIYSLPTFLFFSAYFVILFFWTEVANLQQGYSRNLIGGYVVLNTGMYIFLFGNYIADFAICDYDEREDYPVFSSTPEIVVGAFAASIYLALGLVYAYWAFKFYRSYVLLTQNTLTKISIWNNPLVKLIFLSCLFAAVFEIRCGFVIDGLINDVKMDFWWFDPLFFLVCEVVPVLLMYVILKSNNLSGKTQQGYQNINE